MFANSHDVVTSLSSGCKNSHQKWKLQLPFRGSRSCCHAECVFSFSSCALQRYWKPFHLIYQKRTLKEYFVSNRVTIWLLRANLQIEPPTPVLMKVTFFKVINHQEVIKNGETPFLYERGPYVFIEKKIKEDLHWYDYDRNSIFIIFSSSGATLISTLTLSLVISFLWS